MDEQALFEVCFPVNLIFVITFINLSVVEEKIQFETDRNYIIFEF